MSQYPYYPSQGQQQQQQQQGYYAPTPLQGGQQQGQPIQQGYYPPQQQQMPPQHGAPGYPPPAQTQPYMAYPETHQSLPQVQTYQGHVEGLRGWNDPPAPKASEEDPILKTSEHPENMIVMSVTSALDVVKASPFGQSQQRMVLDTEKRLDELFDKLASSQISRPLLARLMHLSNALTQRAHPAAMQITLQLMTDFMTTEGKWVVGLKRLAEMYART